MIFLSKLTCGGSGGLQVLKFVLSLLDVVLFIIPVILIIFLTLDFSKSVISSSSDDMKKNQNIVIKRIIMCIFLFLVSPIVSLLMNLVDDNVGVNVDFRTCIKIAKTKTDFSKYDADLNIAAGVAIADLFPVHAVITSSASSSGGSVDNSTFLKTADSLWKKMHSGGFEYSLSGTEIPVKGTTIDCSSYVSWALYEYGYKDFEGWQHSTLTFLSEADSYKEKYGWTIIKVGASEDVSSKLQPGDILVRDNGSGGADGHTNIFVKEDGGDLYVYDAGSSSNWANSGGEPIVNNSFAKSDYRSGIIIRITPPPSS